MAIGKHDEKEYYKGYNKYVKDVSLHTRIKEEIVREVMDGLVDVGVEYIVNTGEFRIPEFFMVKAFKHSGGTYDKTGRPRLTSKISHKVRSLWKIRFDKFNGDKEIITASNWKKVYDYYPEYHKYDSSKKQQKQ